MTIGTEEANRLVLDGLRDFMARPSERRAASSTRSR